jgi:hypothetical protein
VLAESPFASSSRPLQLALLDPQVPFAIAGSWRGPGGCLNAVTSPALTKWARPRVEACFPRACLPRWPLAACPLVGERGLFAPALLVARPALTGFIPQPLI